MFSSPRRAGPRDDGSWSSSMAMARRRATCSAPRSCVPLQQLGDRAPVVFLPEGDVGWWHNRAEGPWGSYVLREAIPAVLARTGADPHRVAIGGISMGGFGALNFGR